MEKIPTVYLSQRSDVLVDCFLHQVEKEVFSPLKNQIVLVPNGAVKQWLFLEIAKRKGIAAGLKIFPLMQGIAHLLQASSVPNSLEMFCLLYQVLSQSTHSELYSYIDKEKRLVDLSKTLSSLFFRYGKFGEDLFKNREKQKNWQEEILFQLFIEGTWRFPFQLFPNAKSPTGPIHCFGIDFLPFSFWDYLFRSSSLSLYLFSPCLEFWEDLCTDRERKKWLKNEKISKQVKKELDRYLREAPSPLANWGKLGRENLRVLDRFSIDTVEAYLETDESSLLKRVQSHLLYFKSGEKIGSPIDDSLQVLLTGSSRLREVEVLRDQILSFVLKEKIPFHEIRILAPDLSPYIPLIELVFTESGNSIPYRIEGVDVSKRSSFFQGLSRLIRLGIGAWDADDLLLLFETPSFYQKQKWEEDQLEEFRKWILEAKIEWGWDEKQRKKILSETFDTINGDCKAGSWKKGLDYLLNRIVYLTPEGEIRADLFEEFLSLIHSLKEDLTPLKGVPQTLAFWADRLELLAEKYLSLNSSDEMDTATHASFQQTLQDLRKAEKRIDALYPFLVVQQVLLEPCRGQIHGSQLHAVRFSTIEEGSFFSSRVLFLIGMDEENFPRNPIPNSLDLLKKEKIFGPDGGDGDRYCFLQAIFSCKDWLRISYGHLSADEGKPVSPSLVVQELLSFMDADITVVPSAYSFEACCFTPKQMSYSKSDYRAAKAYYGPKKNLSFWPDMTLLSSEGLPEGEVTLSIHDLIQFAKHPWKFYLQKILGIFLDRSWEKTFSLQKSLCVRSSLFEPIEKVMSRASLYGGPIGEALKMEIVETSDQWKEQMREWGIEDPFTLSFRENGKKIKKEGVFEMPPLEMEWEKGIIRLIGEVKNGTTKGFLHTGMDDLNGLMKVWPEILITAIALEQPQILIIRSGKMKILKEPSLKSYLDYYFRCLKSPTPLLPEWADGVLRKGNRAIGKSDDAVVQWVVDRIGMKDGEKIYGVWVPYLKEVFSSLLAFYPVREKKKETDATV